MHQIGQRKLHVPAHDVQRCADDFSEICSQFGDGDRFDQCQPQKGAGSPQFHDIGLTDRSDQCDIGHLAPE
jgi:hypothetical protein